MLLDEKFSRFAASRMEPARPLTFSEVLKLRDGMKLSRGGIPGYLMLATPLDRPPKNWAAFSLN